VRGIECHIVISTGFFAFFSAERGQLSAAAAVLAPTTVTRLAAIIATEKIPAVHFVLGPRVIALSLDDELRTIVVTL